VPAYAIDRPKGTEGPAQVKWVAPTDKVFQSIKRAQVDSPINDEDERMVPEMPRENLEGLKLANVMDNLDTVSLQELMI